MSENNLNEELWSLIEATDITSVEEPSSYTLLDGLELQDVFFPELEVSAYPQSWDDLDTIELISSDIGANWKVPDVTLPALTTSIPRSTSHTKSDIGCSYEQHPSPTTFASDLLKPIESLSPTGSLVQSPKQLYPKINIIYGQLNKLDSNKDQVRCCNQFDTQSESISSNQSPKCFVGWLNGQELYKLQEDTQDTDTTDSDEDSEEVYIKKPPNAFMLFMTEQRPNISKELWRKGSSTVNSHLATMWRSMSKEEQSTYFNRAAQLKEIHKMNNPTWSTQLNYGKKRHRERKYRVFPLDPRGNYLMGNPGQPMQRRLSLPTYLPQQPYSCSLPQQGALIQAPFPQGSSMFIHPHMSGRQDQNPHLWIHSQEACMQNSEIQAHVPHAPYLNPCPPQGFMRIPDEGVCTLKLPQELCMENYAVVGPVPDHVLEEL